MFSRCSYFTLVPVLAFGVPNLALGQIEKSFHHATFSGGGGLTTITGTLRGTLDHGGNVQVNGGYFFNRYFGVTANFMWSDLGITRAALNDVNEPDGKATKTLVLFPLLSDSDGEAFSALPVGLSKLHGLRFMSRCCRKSGGRYDEQYCVQS